MAEEEAKKVVENETINGGVDVDEEDEEEEVNNEGRGSRHEKFTVYRVFSTFFTSALANHFTQF